MASFRYMFRFRALDWQKTNEDYARVIMRDENRQVRYIVGVNVGCHTRRAGHSNAKSRAEEENRRLRRSVNIAH